MIKLRALKAIGYNCRGSWTFKDCPYKKYGVRIPKGTMMLEIAGEIRYCPSCTEQMLPVLMAEIKVCAEAIKPNKEEEEAASSGVSLLRGIDE
jgi:hypothetical protein